MIPSHTTVNHGVSQIGPQFIPRDPAITYSALYHPAIPAITYSALYHPAITLNHIISTAAAFCLN